MSKKYTRDGREFYKNNWCYIKWFRRLKRIAVSRFKWNNLPSSIDERFLEITLFEKGTAIFFRDDVLGFLTLPTTIQGNLNVYNIPMERMAWANNGYQNFLDQNNSVVIFNDALYGTGYEEIEPWAYELYICNSVKIINVNAQKTPILLQGPESQRLTLENLYMQYEGNKPVIKGTDNLKPEEFGVLKTDAPFVADKLQLMEADIWNEALTALGIPNVAQTKRSALLSDEVERMQGGAFSSRYSGLMMREQACEKINRMFGLDISVEYRLDKDDMFLSPSRISEINEVNVE